jgi:hypothetical protein
MGDLDHQTFTLEYGNSVTNRTAACLHLLGNPHLDETRTGAQLPSDDGVT